MLLLVGCSATGAALGEDWAYPCFTDWQITGKKVAGVRW
jgi:hypothetical protein